MNDQDGLGEANDEQRKRAVAVPIWAIVVVAAVLGAAIASAVILLTVGGGQSGTNAVKVLPTTTTKPTTRPRPRLTTTTVTTTTTTSPPPPTTVATVPPTSPPTPNGTLVVEGVGPSDPTGTLGQGGGAACTAIWICNTAGLFGLFGLEAQLHEQFRHRDRPVHVRATLGWRTTTAARNVIEQANPAVMQISVSIPPHSSQIEAVSNLYDNPATCQLRPLLRSSNRRPFRSAG